MKKKVWGGTALLAIIVLAAINVNVSSQKDNMFLGLTLENVEALAWEWNNVSDWGKYGARADEKVTTTRCSSTTTTNTSTTTSTPSATVGANLTVPINGVPVGVSGSMTTGGTTTTSSSSTTNNIPNGNKKTCESGGNINCDSCECC